MRPWEARARFNGRDMLCGEACKQRGCGIMAQKARS